MEHAFAGWFLTGLEKQEACSDYKKWSAQKNGKHLQCVLTLGIARSKQNRHRLSLDKGREKAKSWGDPLVQMGQD